MGGPLFSSHFLSSPQLLCDFLNQITQVFVLCHSSEKQECWKEAEDCPCLGVWVSGKDLHETSEITIGGINLNLQLKWFFKDYSNLQQYKCLSNAEISVSIIFFLPTLHAAWEPGVEGFLKIFLRHPAPQLACSSFGYRSGISLLLSDDDSFALNSCHISWISESQPAAFHQKPGN